MRKSTCAAETAEGGVEQHLDTLMSQDPTDLKIKEPSASDHKADKSLAVAENTASETKGCTVRGDGFESQKSKLAIRTEVGEGLQKERCLYNPICQDPIHPRFDFRHLKRKNLLEELESSLHDQMQDPRFIDEDHSELCEAVSQSDEYLERWKEADEKEQFKSHGPKRLSLPPPHTTDITNRTTVDGTDDDSLAVLLAATEISCLSPVHSNTTGEKEKDKNQDQEVIKPETPQPVLPTETLKEIFEIHKSSSVFVSDRSKPMPTFRGNVAPNGRSSIAVSHGSQMPTYHRIAFITTEKLFSDLNERKKNGKPIDHLIDIPARVVVEPPFSSEDLLTLSGILLPVVTQLCDHKIAPWAQLDYRVRFSSDAEPASGKVREALEDLGRVAECLGQMEGVWREWRMIGELLRNIVRQDDESEKDDLEDFDGCSGLCFESGDVDDNEEYEMSGCEEEG